VKSQWFYRIGGEESGPHSFDELAELVRSGRITEEVSIRRQGADRWTPASEVVGLFRAARREPAADVSPLVESPAEPSPAVAPPRAKRSEEDAEESEPPVRRRGLPIAVATCVLGVGIAIGTGWQVTRREVPRFQRLPPPAPIYFFGFGPLTRFDYIVCWADVMGVAAGGLWWTASRMTRKRAGTGH
jgi:hypothetical protein